MSVTLNLPIRQFALELYREINDDDIFNGAAALGFYLTLAIFPAMLFLMAVIPYLPIPHVDEAIMDLLRQALPASAADMFTGVVQEVTGEQRGGLLSLGFLGTLWASSSGMYAVMQQLNISYDVKEERGFVRARATAVGLSVLFVVLVLGAFSMIVLGGNFQDWINERFDLGNAVLIFFAAFRWVMIVVGLLLAYALIYYVAPNVKQQFAYITPGAVVGVTVLVVASLGFAWYAQNFGDYAATYGSIGAVIVLMLWLYIAGLSILLGSEINALVEHHAPDGKEKGEKVPGEKERDPAVARRVEQVAPEKVVLTPDQGPPLPRERAEAGPALGASAPSVAHEGHHPTGWRSDPASTANRDASGFASATAATAATVRGPLTLLSRLRSFDQRRQAVPGEHLAALSVGVALLGWAGRSNLRSALLRVAALAGGTALVVRAASGRDGLVRKLRRR